MPTDTTKAGGARAPGPWNMVASNHYGKRYMSAWRMNGPRHQWFANSRKRRARFLTESALRAAIAAATGTGQRSSLRAMFPEE